MHAPSRFQRAATAGWLLACAFSLAACGGGSAPGAAGSSGSGKQGAREEQAVPVETAVTLRQGVVASYAGTAPLEAPIEAQVVAKTSGVLLRVLTEEGQQVRAGQVLARIDPERLRLELQRNQAMMRKLEAEFRRAQELFERKLLAADAHERLRFDLETQRAAYDMARLELSYTDIVAPIDGVIAQRMAKQGNLVQMNQAVFRIVDISRLEAVLNVPERELALLKSGQPVALRVDAAPGVAFDGSIDRISPVVDAGSGTFRVVTSFSDPTGTLKPGMFGRLEVVYDERQNALTVPREALIEGEGLPAVFVVREGRAVRTVVEIGHVTGALAEIRGGLEDGDRVVTTGRATLRDGALLQLLGDPVGALEAEAIAQGRAAQDSAG
ncbi:MAG: efflux RND transporter periplasmic adaptor subunit [Aquimonas sp.]|nr:efflux RND transporter periplasmic adaptor subunit [Aquimonas sp.]